MAKLAVPSFIVGLLGISAAHAGNLPCTLMILDSTDRTYLNKVLEFTDAKSAGDFFGPNPETIIANRFFSFPPDGSCSHQTIKFLRFPITAARAHLYGGNLKSSLSSLNGSGRVKVTSQGRTWTSGNTALSNELESDAKRLVAAINGLNNSNLPTIATFYGSLTPASCNFVGYLSYITLNVTNNGSCVNGPPLGSQICDATFTGNDNGSSCTGGQITSNKQQNMVNSLSYRNNNTSHNPASLPNVGTYSLFVQQGPEPKTTNNTNLTAYYEVLTVNQMSSGTISVGQQIQDGNAVSRNTCVVWSNISGKGNGSRWLVSCENPTAVQEHEKMSTTPCSLEVIPSNFKGVSRLEMSSNNYCPFYTTSIDYLTDVSPGNVAAQLKLTSTSRGSYASSPGKRIIDIASRMNAVLALDSSFDAYDTNYFVLGTSPTNYAGGPAMPYGALPDFLAWTNSRPNHLPAYNHGWK